ncbi:hypothetical protein [Neorhodopirellula pilleata]|uniref:Tetratricopeptide repeat protein n=1 Tax=Neorhodopirellula pilleata TaxID=2714738 RepID=A0A5C5ZR47_9BACT|nr:hypothetical protein [Neorhodopirellula pilleata]TWT89518.1 hypothetical protein Pla100_54470 [Neorhodopirellula pilleata]
MSRPTLESFRIVITRLLLSSVWIGCSGCQTTAPIHLWAPAKLAPIGQESVVLMEIKGPEKTAVALREALLAQADRSENPRFPGRLAGALSLVLPEHLPSEPTIQLVSGTQDDTEYLTPGDFEPTQVKLALGSSDLAIAASARRAGIDQLLHGEVVFATGQEDSPERLAIVWRLVGLTPDATNAGIPVVVDQAIVAERHPDLAGIADPRERLQKAMVRETMALLTGSVHRRQATLADPRGTLGSRAVRRGNRSAEQGNWPAAEDQWVATLKRYPGKTSAWINAAIAAAARQDFIEAKARASRAVTLAVFDPVNRSLAEETLVWIEMRQREYHDAFGLPDPEQGWSVSRSP